MECRNCGKTLDKDERVCGRCGEPAPRGDDVVQRMSGALKSGKDRTAQFSPSDISENKAMGGLAYVLFFLPLIVCPGSAYGRFHANQGLALLITGIIAAIVSSILSAVLLAVSWQLWWLTYLINLVLWLPVAVIGIMGLIGGFTGKARELPLIGKWRIIPQNGGK